MTGRRYAVARGAVATVAAGLVSVAAAVCLTGRTLVPGSTLGQIFMALTLALFGCAALVRIATLVVRRTDLHRRAQHGRPLLPADAWQPPR